jgi:hypothetical protein
MLLMVRLKGKKSCKNEDLLLIEKQKFWLLDLMGTEEKKLHVRGLWKLAMRPRKEQKRR